MSIVFRGALAFTTDMVRFWTLIFLALHLLFPSALAEEKRPNFLWLVSEDTSAGYLRLYGDRLGSTPNIEKLAAAGLVFDRAYSCSPVCSVARTTLATGIYAPRGGFQFHRKSSPARLPEGLNLWPHYLKRAGYFTSNNSKTDFNVVQAIGAVFNENSKRASWRNRPRLDAPFFHMETFTATHESSLHFSRETMTSERPQTPLDEIELAPYHPDTLTFRYTYARFYDRLQQVDAQIGALIERLAEDGLLEDTFIFYFGDHGGVLPRSKGYAYESGLRVPLVLRIPENFKHLVNLERGSRIGAYIQFVDFGPTVLHLAGVEIPPALDGRPFLGPGVDIDQLTRRKEAFGYADRFDEKYDMVRSLHSGKYHYLRNYQAYYPDGLQNNYRYKMLAFEEWRTLWRAGDLNAVQNRFFRERPPEQLFDIEADPHEVNDLAADPDYARILQDMRARLSATVKGVNDLSFYPESHLVDDALNDPVDYGRRHADEIARLIDIADLALVPFERARDRLEVAIHSTNPWERYWGWTTCAAMGAVARPLTEAAEEAAADANLMVRLRATEFIGLIGAGDPRPGLYRILSETHSDEQALLALNAAVRFQDFEPRYPLGVLPDAWNAFQGQVPRRLEYLWTRIDP